MSRRTSSSDDEAESAVDALTANPWGNLLIAAFFIPFLVMACFFTREQARLVVRSIEARSWTVTPARIQRASLQRVRSSRGRTQGWRPEVVYRYAAEGRELEGRAATVKDLWPPLSSVSWDFFRSSQRWVDDLSAAAASGRSVDCRVNPQEPSQAILGGLPFEEWVESFFVWGLFGLALGLFSGTIVVGMLLKFVRAFRAPGS